jgi:hypothetical protein
MTCGANECPADASPKPSRHGYCEKHYQRWKNYGDANHLTPKMLAMLAAEQFWQEIRDHGHEERDACLEWPACTNANGYGITTRNGERLVPRAVWVEMFGPIPPGHLVCHTCDNPPCAWPSHLFLGDHKANSADMVDKGRNATFTGELNPRTTIPDALVAELRRRHDGGATYKALARELGVHPVTVSRICRRERRSAVA